MYESSKLVEADKTKRKGKDIAPVEPQKKNTVHSKAFLKILNESHVLESTARKDLKTIVGQVTVMKIITFTPEGTGTQNRCISLSNVGA